MFMQFVRVTIRGGAAVAVRNDQKLDIDLLFSQNLLVISKEDFLGFLSVRICQVLVVVDNQCSHVKKSQADRASAPRRAVSFCPLSVSSYPPASRPPDESVFSAPIPGTSATIMDSAPFRCYLLSGTSF